MKIEIGAVAEAKRIFTAELVENYAKLTGDYNPVHFDDKFAQHTIFRKPIVHGPLVLTLITTLFANKLPGAGSVYLSHDLKFVAPVYHNDEVTAYLKIIEITSKNHCIIETKAYNQDGIIVIEGIARIKVF